MEFKAIIFTDYHGRTIHVRKPMWPEGHLAVIITDGDKEIRKEIAGELRLQIDDFIVRFSIKNLFDMLEPK